MTIVIANGYMNGKMMQVMNAIVAWDDLSCVDISALAAAKGWQAQYKLMIGYGRAILPKPWLRQPDCRLDGCEVPTWFYHHVDAGRHYYFFDCDSRVINGLVAVLLAPYQARTDTPANIDDVLAPLIHAGVDKHLTPSRNNGLLAIARALVS